MATLRSLRQQGQLHDYSSVWERRKPEGYEWMNHVKLTETDTTYTQKQCTALRACMKGLLCGHMKCALYNYWNDFIITLQTTPTSANGNNWIGTNTRQSIPLCPFRYCISYIPCRWRIYFPTGSHHKESHLGAMSLSKVLFAPQRHALEYNYDVHSAKWPHKNKESPEYDNGFQQRASFLTKLHGIHYGEQITHVCRLINV